ncbi:hypothetical protein B0H14DRAFT_2592100 [Mycena olivaceomarginata]|nr:hypothetical protein B0H14DRAFT_2592100 [Mycena olivaceomarginata]
MAKFTIDTLLAMIGLRKSEVAQKYMTPEQRYITAAIGDASTTEDDNEGRIAPPGDPQVVQKTALQSQINCHRGRGGWQCGDGPPPPITEAGSPSLEKSADGKRKGKASADVEHKNTQKKAKETDDEPAEADKGHVQPRLKRVKPNGSTDAGPSAPLTRTRAKRVGATSTQDAAGAPKTKARARKKNENAGKDMADEGTHPSRRQAPTEEDSDAETPRSPVDLGRVG